MDEKPDAHRQTSTQNSYSNDANGNISETGTKIPLSEMRVTIKFKNEGN